jgi:hypothetical protein
MNSGAKHGRSSLREGAFSTSPSVAAWDETARPARFCTKYTNIHGEIAMPFEIGPAKPRHGYLDENLVGVRQLHRQPGQLKSADLRHLDATHFHDICSTSLTKKGSNG